MSVQDLSWMRRFTDTETRFKVAQQPWSVEYESEWWSVATNGRVLVMVKGANDFLPILQEDALKLLPVISPEKPPPPLIRSSVTTISEWCGPPDWGVEIECPSCWEPFIHGGLPRRGLFLTIPIDKNQLAKPLAHFSGDVAVSGSADNPLHFVGDGWRIVLMPLDSKTLAEDGEMPDPAEAFVLEPSK